MELDKMTGTEFIIGSMIMGGMSMIGGSQAASAADEASRRQEQSAAADLAFRQRVYDERKGLYGPLEQRLVAMANSDQPLNWSQVSGQISNQYSDQVRQVTQMGGQGQYGGLKYDRLAKLGLANATGKVAAYNQGLMNKLNLQTGLVGGGQQSIMNAAQMVGQGMSNNTQMYGQQSAMYGQAAAGAYQAAGQSMTTALMAAKMFATPSDKRLKRDIEFLKYENDLKIYKFKYKWSEDVYVGVMAQDLLGTEHESAVTVQDGFYAVDYTKLGIELMLLDKYLSAA